MRASIQDGFRSGIHPVYQSTGLSKLLYVSVGADCGGRWYYGWFFRNVIISIVGCTLYIRDGVGFVVFAGRAKEGG